MTITQEEAVTVTTDQVNGIVTCTNGDYRFEYRPDQAAWAMLGGLSPSGVTDSRREYDPSALMYDLIRAACTWEGEGRDLAIQAAINCEYQIRENMRLRNALATRGEVVSQRDAAMRRYKATVREAVLEAYSSHRHHVSKSDLNDFLESLSLERVPTTYEVTVHETATRTGTVTVEADDEDEAVQIAYGKWENDDIDWDDWDSQESDTDKYDVEEDE